VTSKRWLKKLLRSGLVGLKNLVLEGGEMRLLCTVREDGVLEK
jgi:hypothetical protein